MAGVGPAFTGLSGLAASYHDARRALRHASQRRPVVHAPRDILLFDELAKTAGDDASQLVPRETKEALGDPLVRSSIETFFTASMNIAEAAKALSMHPNSFRYRLRRVHSLTGRDPWNLTDLVELMAAVRLTKATNGR